jgi:heme exporter protein D
MLCTCAGLTWTVFLFAGLSFAPTLLSLLLLLLLLLPSLLLLLQDVHREAQREAANVARRDERGGGGGPPDRMGGRDRGGPGGYGGGPPGQYITCIVVKVTQLNWVAVHVSAVKASDRCSGCHKRALQSQRHHTHISTHLHYCEF